MQIGQWTPYAETGLYVVWEQDNAHVWAWDAQRVEKGILSSKLQLKGTSIVPETLLHRRQSQGAYLVACLEGYEGQVWRDDSIYSSRWWPELPATNEWINFQMDAGLMPERQSNEVPAALPLSLGEAAWARSAVLNGSAFYGDKAEQWIVPAIVLCLFTASMWYGAQWIKLQAAIRSQGKELEALSQQAAPIIEERGKALEALGRIKLLQSLDPYPDQISLLGKVAEALPMDGPYLKEWEFQNGKLKIQITSPNKLMSSDYIKLFESMELFKNVQAAPGGDPTVLTLNMEIIPQAVIKFATNTDQAAKSVGVVTPLR